MTNFIKLPMLSVTELRGSNLSISVHDLKYVDSSSGTIGGHSSPRSPNGGILLILYCIFYFL